MSPDRPRSLGSLCILVNEHWQEICSEAVRSVKGWRRRQKEVLKGKGAAQLHLQTAFK